MNAEDRILNTEHRPGPAPAAWFPILSSGWAADFAFWISKLFLLVLAVLAAPHDSTAASAGNPPASPREFYNDGTQRYREGKLREAELSLQAAVASEDERVQPAALYNLGHVRFQQGVEALRQAPNGQAARARGNTALGRASGAIAEARAALAGDNVGALVNAYLQGRGARKELKAATEAVKKALTAHGAVLSKWQRASGDFESAAELQPKLDEARFNAEVVDRHIAALVDQQQLLMQCMQGLGEKRQELGDLLKKLKGRIPGGLLPKAPGDEDEDDEEDGNQPPPGPQAGQEEKETKEGHAMALDPGGGHAPAGVAQTRRESQAAHGRSRHGEAARFKPTQLVMKSDTRN